MLSLPNSTSAGLNASAFCTHRMLVIMSFGHEVTRTPFSRGINVSLTGLLPKPLSKRIRHCTRWLNVAMLAGAVCSGGAGLAAV